MKNHYYNFNFTKKNNLITDLVKSVFSPLLLAIAIIALPIKRADAQTVPTLSYNSPQVYLPNTVITPLAPASSGVASPAYSTTPVNISTGLSSPFGVATDAAGNLYVSDLATKIVKEFPAGGGSPVIIGSGIFSHPEGITVDAAGNVYAAGDYDGQITEVLKSDGSAVHSGTGFNEFSGVAVDATGNIYVADFSNNNPVKEILKSNGNTVPIGTGFSNYVIAVATDAAANVYVADTHNGIMEILASNGNTISLGTGFSNPQGVAVDAAGNVFVSDQGNGAIKEIPAGSSTPITLVSGLTNPGQIAVDGVGNIYFVDTTNGTVQEITPVGGYYINALPPGLSFNNSTGVISGTPTANVPPTNYTVTAYNSTGSASAVINITVGTPPAPTLSYQSPQTYTTGDAIFPLTPSSTGVSTPAYSGTKNTFGSGYNDDQSVATDAAGNIYVTDQYNNAVKKIPAGGGTQVTVASNLTGGLYGVAVDAQGNLYVSESSGNAVLKIPAGGGSPVSIGSGFNGPTGLAVDAAGNVYVAEHLGDAIKEISASDGSTKTLATGVGNPYSVAVDAAGNLYVAATFHNAIVKIPAGGGSPVSIGSGFNTPQGVAVDAVGNVYVSDFGNTSVKMIAVDGSTTTIATNFSYPQGVAVDGAGNVYLADAGTDVVYQLTPSGGYYINSAVPAGLTFNGATGVISGTPSVVSLAKDYAVTAYNVAGSAKATVNLAVVAPVTITSITRQNAALTNTFYAAYTVVFSGPVTGLTPSNFSVTATGGITGTSINYISGSGNTFTVVAFTGTGDGTVTLNMANDVGVEPGISTVLPFAGDTYTIDKTPPTITIGNPSATSTSSGPITYTVTYADANFNASTLSPSDITLNTTGSATGTVSVSGSGSATPTVIISNISGSGTLGISIAAGTASDLATNTAPAAGPSATFTVTPATIAGGATLSNISFSTNTTRTSIAGPGYQNYATTVDPGTTSLTLKPTAVDPSATITVNGTTVASGTSSGIIQLPKVSTMVTIVVTAADGKTSNTYYVTVNRTGSNDALLKSLDVTPNTGLTRTAVTVNSVNYNVTVPLSATEVTIDPTVDDAGAKVTIGAEAVTSGSASNPIPLNATGATVITLVVTANDGHTTENYILTITKTPSANANLISLVLPLSMLDEVSTTLTDVEYTTSVAPNTTSYTVTPGTADPNATVTVNGISVISGTTSGAISLNTAPGATTLISIVVTAEDGIHQRTYNITLSRSGSNDARLKGLGISSGTVFTKVTGPGYENLVTSVDYNSTSVEVRPITDDPNATLTVNGASSLSGVYSQPITLYTGPGATTTITIAVTAPNGEINNYIITVSRTGSSNAMLSKITLTPKATLTATTGSSSVNYAATLPQGTQSVIITPVGDANATILVNGSTVASGTPSGPIALNTGDNLVSMMVTAQDGVTTKTYSITITVPGVVAVLRGPKWSIPAVSSPLPAKDVNDVVVHEALSPNGDGINDVLTIDGIAAHPDNKLSIMNTNGTLVFEAKGYDNISRAFDGHDSHGNMQKPGTYFYLLSYKDGDDIKTKTGYVILKY